MIIETTAKNNSLIHTHLIQKNAESILFNDVIIIEGCRGVCRQPDDDAPVIFSNLLSLIWSETRYILEIFCDGSLG